MEPLIEGGMLSENMRLWGNGYNKDYRLSDLHWRPRGFGNYQFGIEGLKNSNNGEQKWQTKWKLGLHQDQQGPMTKALDLPRMTLNLLIILISLGFRV